MVCLGQVECTSPKGTRKNMAPECVAHYGISTALFLRIGAPKFGGVGEWGHRRRWFPVRFWPGRRRSSWPLCARGSAAEAPDKHGFGGVFWVFPFRICVFGVQLCVFFFFFGISSSFWFAFLDFPFWSPAVDFPFRISAGLWLT